MQSRTSTGYFQTQLNQFIFNQLQFLPDHSFL